LQRFAGRNVGYRLLRELLHARGACARAGLLRRTTALICVISHN
jgi:hypothetical protein